ncbi:MAG: hypothetical protein Q7R64_02970 [bacterium]|nr:hypothetical protein [bacterium]
MKHSLNDMGKGLAIALFILSPLTALADTLWTSGASNSILNANTGNIGLGTTVPYLKLDVAGSGRFTGGPTSTLTGTADPTASATLIGTGTLFLSELVPGDRITINGETRSVLAIASNTNLTVSPAFTDTASATITKIPALFITRNSAGTNKLVQDDLGNVSITTSSLGSDNVEVLSFTKLGGTAITSVSSNGSQFWNFEGNGTTFGKMAFSTPGGKPGIAIWTGTYLNRFDIANYGAYFGLGYNATGFTLNITNDGKVGIGTTTPTEALDVAGNIKLTGSLVSDGDICIGVCQ